MEWINFRPPVVSGEIERFLREQGCDDSIFEWPKLRTTQIIPNYKEVIIGDWDSERVEGDSREFTNNVKTNFDSAIGEISSDFVADIDIAQATHWKFVSKCRDHYIPPYKGVKIGYERHTSKKNDYDRTFIILHKRKEPKFGLFKGGLQNLISQATQEVYIDFFVLDNNSLKFILETSRNVRRLVLRGWEAHINTSFSINLSINYLIEDINLFGTWDNGDMNYMTLNKLDIFASVLASTKLRTSLSIIRVSLQLICIASKIMLTKQILRPFINLYLGW